MLREFIYTIKLVVQNSLDGSLFYIEKSFTDSITVGPNDYFVAFPISPSKTDEALKEELQKYADENQLDTASLQVITKEIYAEDESIDIYFDENEDDSIHDYNPDMNVEFKPPTSFKPLTPQFFRGYQETQDSITWSWEIVTGCAYRIIDDNGDTVSNVGEGNFRWIETGVVPGIYSRRIVAYNADGDSDESAFVVITVEEDSISEPELKPGDQDNSTTEDIEIIPSFDKTIRDFKSGIGDGLDLYTEKTDVATLCERFNIETHIEAFNTVEQRLYTPIDVDYFIRATGNEVHYGEPDSMFQLRIVPWPVEDIMFSVYSIISEPISFEVEYELDIIYQTKRSPNAKIELKGCKEFPKELPVGTDLHIVLKDESGDIPDNDVTFTTSSGTITANGKLRVSSPGEVEVKAYYKYYNITISKTILFTVDAEVPTFSMSDDYQHADAYNGGIVNGYRLARKIVPYKKRFTIDGVKEDEEISNLETYIRNCDNDILSSPQNTIQVVYSNKLYGSNEDIQTRIDGNSVRVTTRQNERIYVYRKTHRAKLSIDQKSSLRLVDPDKITYRNKYNVAYTGNIAPSTTIDYLDVPASITLYDDDGTINPTVIENKKPSLSASIDTPSMNTIISGITNTGMHTSSFQLHTMFGSSELSASEYVLEIVELKIEGEIEYETSHSDTTVVMDGNKFIHINNVPGAILSVGGVKTKRIVPFVKESETISCVVNGKKPYVYDYDGKENYVENAPVFIYNVETEDVEYEAILFSKAEKRVDAEFENGHKYRCTKRNGDVLIISSGDYEIVNMYKKQLVSHSVSEEYELNTHTAFTFETYIYNPLFNSAAETAELESCDVYVKANNPNIRITTDIKTIDFTLPQYKDQIKVPITVTASIISASQTSWAPVINSGYYYINNHEYYLYGESNLLGEFCKEERPIEKTFFASVIANIESRTNSLPVTRLLSGATSFAYGSFTKTIIDDGNVTLAFRTIGGKKLYHDDGIYITDDIVLGSELNNVTVKYDGDYLDNVKCFITTNNGVEWTPWLEIPNEYRLDSDEYIQKFKIKFELRRLVDQDIDYSERTSIYAEGDFKATGYSATNVIIQSRLITQDDVSQIGIYESPPCEVREDSTYVFVEPQSLSHIAGKYELHMALSATKDFSTATFKKAVDRIAVGNNKYYKYKLIFPVNSKVGFNAIDTITSYTSTSQVSVSPIIKSVETSSIPKEWIFAGTIKKPLLCKIKADMTWRYVTDHNILDMIYPDIAIAGIRNPRVQDIIVELMDDEVEIQYDLKKDGRIAARTKFTETEIVDSKFINIDKSYIGYITPVPKLGAPVIAMYNDIPLVNINNYDEEDNLTNVITEHMTYQLSNVLSCIYNNIDQDTVTVSLGNETIPVEKVINNRVVINDAGLTVGQDLVVKYKVKYSFGVNTQYSNDKAQLTVHLEHGIEESEYSRIMVHCETSDHGLYSASEVELNPMYGIEHTGFMYLSEEKSSATRIELCIDKTDFKATTTEDIYFTARVTDHAGNPVPYIPVRVTTTYGKIKMVSNVTNTSGVISAKYIHPTYQCDDTVTVSIGDTKIKDAVDIRIEKDSKFVILNANVEDSKYIVNNGESIVLKAELFEDNLAPMVGKEIVTEMVDETGMIVSKHILTDANGSCSFDITPCINIEDDKCLITVSHLSVTADVYIKVVDKND